MAGLVGSIILATGLRLNYPISLKYIAMLIIVGALSGIPNPDFFRIFPIWQTAVAVAIGLSVEKSVNKETLSKI